MTKPIYLIDLDDNFFQTKRKLSAQNKDPYRVAAVDREYKPRSYFTLSQSNYIDWLMVNANVIPVTARGTEETARVNVNFKSWMVMTHGAVIRDPDGFIDSEWEEYISERLKSYQDVLAAKQEALTRAFADSGVNAWARINYEYDGLAIYLVAKHTDSDLIQEMYDIADKVDSHYGTTGFYVHRNGNNIAWIPTFIEKGLAVKYLLNKLKTKEMGIPVIGFGDSISDYTFLKQCDWFGMPHEGQITTFLDDEITELGQ